MNLNPKLLQGYGISVSQVVDAVRQGGWKIVWDQALPEAQRGWQLYDIVTDFEEQHDLAPTNAAQLATMQQAWASYAQRNGVIY